MRLQGGTLDNPRFGPGAFPRAGLFFVPVAANQLINGGDEGIEFVFGISMERSEFLKAGLHAIHKTEFGLGQPADQIGNGRNLLIVLLD